MPIRPGQIKPNEFEMSILNRLADKEPAIRFSLETLHVLSREFTGVGSFTTFKSDASTADASETNIPLGELISMPAVAHGMGAVLFLRNGQPQCLEVYTFGDEHWDGVYHGFTIQPIA